jgi:hypothetical protein
VKARLQPFAPALATGAAVVAIWLASGVEAGEVARFVAYQAGFIVAPGVLLYAALGCPGPTRLPGIAIGWALGYAIEIGAFALAGELHAPWVQATAQAAVALICAAILMRRRREGTIPGAPAAWPWSGSSQWRWVVAGIAGLAVAYIAIASFTQTPLPGHFEKVNYFLDLVFQLSVAAEALHHWPIADPKVVGQALPYHTFVDMDMAGISRVTQIALPTVLFRLYIVPLVVLVALQVSSFASAVSRRRWVGPLAAALVFFVGEVDPSADQASVFFNTFFFSLHTSPSFMFGLIFFLPALFLIWSLSDAAEGRGIAEPGRRRGAWVALGLILAACSGAKASILPVILGGLAVYLALAWLTSGRRRWDGGALRALGLCLVVFAASYAVLYGGESGGLALHLPGTVSVMRPVELVDPGHYPLPLAAPVWAVAVVVGVLGFCGAYLLPIGAASLALRGWIARPWRVMLLSLGISGLVPMVTLTHVGYSENFFTYYGYVALAILGADALVSLAERWLDRRAVRAAAAGALLAAGATALAIAALGSQDEVGSYETAAAALAILGAAVIVAWRARARGFLTLPVAVAALLAAVLAYGAMDTPLDVSPDLIRRHRDGVPLYSQSGNGLTPQLLQGLDWIRENSSTDAVLAVNNQYLGAHHLGPGYMYYSAFAERRVYLEGWADTLKTQDVGAEAVATGEEVPFPDRLRLNQAVFRTANVAGLEDMARAGVTLLVVDRENGGPSPAIARLTRPVFSNPAVDVYPALAVLRAAQRAGHGPRTKAAS